jgi:putative ABC transport system permease protein
MPSLSRRNLLHDRVRFAVTLTGIVFAVVLSAVQLGLFVGFRRATSDLIAHAGADVWVMSRGIGNLENAVAFPEQRLYQVQALPGVAAVQKHVIAFGNWKRPDGAEEGCLVIGVEQGGTMGGPWNLVEGTERAIDAPDAVIVDALYRGKLGVSHLGQVVEIRGRRARVAGLTRGIRTFTTAPPVFTSFKHAQGYVGLREDQTLFLLVKAVPGVEPSALAARIEASVPDVTALTREAWMARQQDYWMFGTGAGVSVLIAAALGLLVGVVVVAQTTYSSTVDHIREYGTLKAMGATNGYLYRVIVEQAVTSAVVGFAIAIVVALATAHASQQGTTAIVIPPAMVAGLFVLTVLMCVAASVVSIDKVTRIDPAMVFKG